MWPPILLAAWDQTCDVSQTARVWPHPSGRAKRIRTGDLFCALVVVEPLRDLCLFYNVLSFEHDCTLIFFECFVQGMCRDATSLVLMLSVNVPSYAPDIHLRGRCRVHEVVSSPTPGLPAQATAAAADVISSRAHLCGLCCGR